MVGKPFESEFPYLEVTSSHVTVPACKDSETYVIDTRSLSLSYLLLVITIRSHNVITLYQVYE